MRLFLFFSICSIFAIILFSCKDKTTQSSITFEGITETGPTGPTPIGKIDPDDWKPMMNCSDTSTSIHVPMCTKLFPAYPNPANKTFMIVFSLDETDSVIITLNSAPSTAVKELFNYRTQAGLYTIRVDGNDLSPAIYRVYMQVYRRSDVLGSYGDVQIIN